MKFFIDTAAIEEIREAKSLGMVDGVTTNPSLIAKTGKEFHTVVKEICDEIEGPISVEIVSDAFEDMVAEARGLAEIASNIVIKVPCTAEGLKTTRALRAEGIGTNMTLVFSPAQALLAAKAGAAFVSPFIGRLDDISQTGMDLIAEINMIYENYDFETEVIVASIRHPLHVVEAAQIGADIATIPLKVITQLVSHPLTTIGIEKFLADWDKVPK